MISWSEICPALVAIFSEIAVDTDLQTSGFTAEWKEGPRGAISQPQRLTVLLKITSVVGIGTDETRREDVPEDSVLGADAALRGELREVLVGQRKFTLQVQAIVPEHTDSLWAMAATERMRTRICRKRILQALDDVNVAIIDIKPANKVSFKDGGRVVSAAVMDFIFATSVNDADPIPYGWIERIVLDSHISDTDGVELPVPPNVVGETLPPL